MEPVRFDGRVAVVTGAGRGLGREFALLLASRGAVVVVNDIGVSLDAARYRAGTVDRDTPADPAEAVVAEIEAAGGVAVASHADVTDSAQVGQMVESAVQRFGSVDIVINNAGIVLTAPFEELTNEMFSRCFEVHVNGAFNVGQAVVVVHDREGLRPDPERLLGGRRALREPAPRRLRRRQGRGRRADPGHVRRGSTARHSRSTDCCPGRSPAARTPWTRRCRRPT